MPVQQMPSLLAGAPLAHGSAPPRCADAPPAPPRVHGLLPRVHGVLTPAPPRGVLPECQAALAGQNVSVLGQGLRIGPQEVTWVGGWKKDGWPAAGWPPPQGHVHGWLASWAIGRTDVAGLVRGGCRPLWGRASAGAWRGRGRTWGWKVQREGEEEL